MKVMVFDVGGTEIKYSVMDERMNRFDAGSVPTPQDTQEHFFNTIYALYAPHKDEVDGIAMALPGFVDANTGYVSNGGALLYNTGTQVGRLVREDCGCRVTLGKRQRRPARPAWSRCWRMQWTMFIIGTGVGGGIIANGQLVRGVHFTAGELQLCEHQRRRVGEYRKNHGLPVQHQISAQVVSRPQGPAPDAPHER